MFPVLSPTLASGARPNFLYPSDPHPVVTDPFAFKLADSYGIYYHSYQLEDGPYACMSDWLDGMARRHGSRFNQYVIKHISWQLDPSEGQRLYKDHGLDVHYKERYLPASVLYRLSLSLPGNYANEPLCRLREFLVKAALKRGAMPDPLSLGFPLQSVVDEGDRYYSIHDWMAGLCGKSEAVSWTEIICQSGHVWMLKAPYQYPDGRRRKRVFTELEGLLWIAANLPSTPQTTTLNTLKQHMAQAGVWADTMRALAVGGAA